MRRSLLVALLLLVPGCLDDSRGGGDGEAEAGDGGDGNNDSAASATLAAVEVLQVDGVVQAGLRVPTMVGAPVEANPLDEPARIAMPEDYAWVVFELVWPDQPPAPRADLALRAVSAADHYFYAGGAGTPAEPARIDTDHQTTSFDVLPIGDVVVEQPWTAYVSIFAGEVPDGYTAVKR